VPTSARILVIEDNNENIELVDYLLTASGYAPVLAMSGEDGLRIADELEPDLILLDIRLPGIDGYEVATAIKARPALADTRIVAVTASAMLADRTRISVAGFDGYIQKPIDPQLFIGQIESLLSAPRRDAGAFV
jgi:two-component system cell cycle response regulator